MKNGTQTMPISYIAIATEVTLNAKSAGIAVLELDFEGRDTHLLRREALRQALTHWNREGRNILNAPAIMTPDELRASPLATILGAGPAQAAPLAPPLATPLESTSAGVMAAAPSATPDQPAASAQTTVAPARNPFKGSGFARPRAEAGMIAGGAGADASTVSTSSSAVFSGASDFPGAKPGHAAGLAAPASARPGNESASAISSAQAAPIPAIAPGVAPDGMIPHRVALEDVQGLAGLVDVYVDIHTDGSCQGNPGPGGAGIVYQACEGYGREVWRIEMSRYLGDTRTNNQAEMEAFIMALEHGPGLLGSATFSVYSDSQYTVKGFNEWRRGWAARGWTKSNGDPVMNVDLWKKISNLSWEKNVEAVWVRGHDGNQLNEIADRLAGDAARSGAGISGALLYISESQKDLLDRFSRFRIDPADPASSVAGDAVGRTSMTNDETPRPTA